MKFRFTVSTNKKNRQREIKAHKTLHEHIHVSQSYKQANDNDNEVSTLIDLLHIIWKSYLVTDKRDQYHNLR